jgi:alpha-tubulin suppressor-like RCC1 family protein
MKRSAQQQTATGHRPRRLAAGGLAVAAIAGLTACSAPAAGSAAGSGGGPARAAAPLTGSLVGWGGNFAGQLGDGAAGAASFVPVRTKLPAGTNVAATQAACGDGYALTTGGQLLAWGDNSEGQLGDGSHEIRSSIPVQVSLPPGTKIISLRVGCDHSVALTITGAVLAWGSNHEGALGDGGSEALRRVPVRVRLPAATKIIAVSAGTDYSLALTASGQVLAWGSNVSGTLGDGDDAAASPVPVRVKLPTHTRVTAISAGAVHSLALTATGAVLAWGDNRYSELGDGGAGKLSRVPFLVSLPGGAQARSVSAGSMTSLVLTSTMQVLAWGINRNGELGTGSRAGASPVPVRVRLPAGSPVVAISAGNEHDAALTATGRVFGWGAGSLLGTGSSSPADSLPAQAHLPAGMSAVSIDAGPDATSTLAIVASVRL